MFLFADEPCAGDKSIFCQMEMVLARYCSIPGGSKRSGTLEEEREVRFESASQSLETLSANGSLAGLPGQN